MSLVPQALTGHLPEDSRVNNRRNKSESVKQRREPNLARGIRKSFSGLAFLTIMAALFITRGGNALGSIWLLMPALFFLGKGISEIVTVLSAANAANQMSTPRSAASTNQLSSHQEFESRTPPSVTENTTRHMDPIPDGRRESN